MADIFLPRRSSGGGGRPRRAAIPDAGDVPRVNVPSDPGLKVPAGAFGSGIETAGDDLGEAGLQLGRATQLAKERQQKQYDATKTKEAELAFEDEAQKELQRRQVEDDPSRPEFLKEYESWLGQRATALHDNLDEGVSQFARESLRLTLKDKSNGLTRAAGTLSLKAGQDRALAVIDTKTNQYGAQAQRDPGSLDVLLTDGEDDLTAFAGTMTPQAETKAKVERRANIILGAVQGMANRGQFTEAGVLLASGKYDADLDRGARTKAQAMIESARRERDRLAEKHEKDADKRLKAEGDQGLKDFHAILGGGSLPTAEDVDRLRRNPGVSPAEYKGVVDALKSEAEKDDEDFLLRITPRLDTEDLIPEIALAARENRITGKTALGLMDKNRTQRREDQPASPYKSGRGFLTTALDPGQIGNDPTIRQPLAIAQANALADYDIWIEQNRNADRTTALVKARELTEQYQNVAFQNMRLALPRPRGYGGAKDGVTQKEIDAARSSILADLDAQRVSPALAGRELEQLETWERVLARPTTRAQPK